MWRERYEAAKAAQPALNFGKSTTAIKPQHIPTSNLGWQLHYEDQRKAKMANGGSAVHPLAAHLGSSLGNILTDNPGDQQRIVTAVSSALNGPSARAT
jgi:hypothetical protein